MDEVLPTMQIVHEAERHFARMFTTLCMLTIAPDRASARIRLAGHPPPLLIAGRGTVPLEAAPIGPPLGVVDDAQWVAADHPLPTTGRCCSTPTG